MAKTISKMQTKGSKNLVKIVISEKSEKSGHYTFKEKIVAKDQVNELLKK